MAALDEVFRFGCEYQKVGIILTNLVPTQHLQQNLFTTDPDTWMANLSGIMDKLNHKYGRGKIRLAGASFDPSWHHKRQFLSPCYTTNWKDILKVN